MSASAVCLLCLCTLFPNPQEARRRRGGRIKKGEKELRGENVEKTQREWLLRKEAEAGEGCIFTPLLFVERFSTLSNYSMSEK